MIRKLFTTTGVQSAFSMKIYLLCSRPLCHLSVGKEDTETLCKLPGLELVRVGMITVSEGSQRELRRNRQRESPKGRGDGGQALG